MRIGFIPIDDRPVCYTLPKNIAEINSEIEFFIPNRELLGNLQRYADNQAIMNWLEKLENLDAIILSLDTVAYGGLISSRRCEASFEEIKSRLDRLKEILVNKKCKVYAFSSIMRISNNNINEEEKPYWDKWGKKIFDYSYHTHKFNNQSCIHTLIPTEILNDYIDTRNRNFNINKLYLEWQKEGLFELLVFSKDDCAEYGFNVQEAQFLQELGGFVKTGADEIPLSLLSRAICDFKNLKLNVAPIFIEDEHKNLISNYEDISIENSVKGQLELANCKLTNIENADIVLYINNFKVRQGEIVMKTPTEPFSGDFQLNKDKYFMIADVRYANGSDNNFVDYLFNNYSDILNNPKFLGYSAWNTSANSVGSLICGAISIFSANKTLNKDAMKRLFLTRLLDDWAYQANVRQSLESPNKEFLTNKMQTFERILNCNNMQISYSFPWNRLFEVEIEFN